MHDNGEARYETSACVTPGYGTYNVRTMITPGTNGAGSVTSRAFLGNGGR